MSDGVDVTLSPSILCHPHTPHLNYAPPQFGAYALGFAVVGLMAAVGFERALSGSGSTSCWDRAVGRCKKACCPRWCLVHLRRPSAPTLPINFTTMTQAEKTWEVERRRHRVRVSGPV